MIEHDDFDDADLDWSRCTVDGCQAAIDMLAALDNSECDEIVAIIDGLERLKKKARKVWN